MEIKKSDIKLERFSVLACNIVTIPASDEKSKILLTDMPIFLDFNIQNHIKNNDKIKIILEIKSNNEKSRLPGYSYSVVAEAEYNIKNFSQMDEESKNKQILFTALPLIIAMVRSFLYNATSSYIYGHYLLPTIDLPDLFKKKFGSE